MPPAIIFPHLIIITWPPKASLTTLIIFDPSGYATNAIDLFKQAAEQCQTILFCSDQSKNGSYETNIAIFEKMYADVQQKFNINEKAQFLAGFSGGSRLATVIAVLYPDIDGVIACGAGFAPVEKYQPTRQNDFGYYGIVGKKDMNYVEMLNIEDKLLELNLDHYFVYTEAGHFWPGEEYHSQALIWQMARLEEKRQNLGENYSGIFMPIAKRQLDTLWSQAEKLDYHHLKTAIEATFPSQIKQINLESISEEELTVLVQKRKELIQTESDIKRNYHAAYNLSSHKILDYKSDEWWIAEYKKWSKIASKNSLSSAYQASRIQNHLSAMFYESLYGWLMEKDYEKAAWTGALLTKMIEKKPILIFCKPKLQPCKKNIISQRRC